MQDNPLCEPADLLLTTIPSAISSLLPPETPAPQTKSPKTTSLRQPISYLLPLSIFLLAVVVRLLYNLTVARNYTPIFDAGLYDILARHLLSSHCYCLVGNRETVSRAPLWPFLLAGIYALFGPYSFYGRLFYCFLGSFTCVLTYLLAKDLFGWRIALFVGIVSSVYTGLFLYDGWLYSESLYTFFSMGFTYALFRLQGRLQSSLPIPPQLARKPWLFWKYPLVGGWPWFIISSLCLACATLTRPNGSSLFALVVAWSVILLLLKMISWQAALKSTLIISLLAIGLILPWTYRNYLVSHRFVLVATGMGEVLLGSYNDGMLARGGWWLPPRGAVIHDNPHYTPDNDKQDTARALTWIRTHMRDMPQMLTLHFDNLWTPYHYSFGLPFEEFPKRASSRMLIDLINNQSMPIFRLATLGLILTWKRRRQLVIVYLILLQTVFLNVAFYSIMRFRAPIEPLLVLFVGGVLWWVISSESGTLRFFIARLRKRLAPTV
jgi:hypothetical protein